jgi:long-chain acyl-CoA synthetase
MENERVWLKNYAAGIPANINPDQYPSVLSLLNETMKKYKKAPAFSCMGKTLTFGEIDIASHRFAAYLHSRGLEPGDKIGLMMPNLLQYPIALFGAFRAGLIVVNTNPLYTSHEMLHQFKDSGIKAVVIAENFASNLEKIVHKTEIKTVIVTSIGELLGAVKGTVVNFVVRNVKKMVPAYNIPNVVPFAKALKEGSHFTPKSFDTHPEDVVLLQYTGGTTGVSKGAMLTNRNLVSNMLQIQALIKPYLEDENNIALSPLPMYHIFAFTVNVMALASIGTLNVLITNARDLPSVIKEFGKFKINLMTGVNTLFNGLLNHPDFAKADFSALKVTVGGGMAVQNAVAEKWQQVTGCVLSEGYGMTEASPVVTCNPVDGTGKIGTIGMPLPSTEVRVVDDQGNAIGIGEVGEIQVKGPQVMKGYFNRQDETEKVLKEGWLSTGDLGLMQPDGYFKIVDRKKDMIIVSGFNVYPNEIEDVIAKHPKVLEVAAIGIPDEKSTEAVKVFVVKKDNSLTEKEIIEYCREYLTGYKIPKVVEWRKELPKTNVGKILRRMLKDENAA